VLDLSGVPLADSSAAASLKTFVDQARRHGAEVFVAGASAAVRHVLVRSGLKVPVVRYAANIAEARLAAGAVRPA
jgi:SulP family sulfate permease